MTACPDTVVPILQQQQGPEDERETVRCQRYAGHEPWHEAQWRGVKIEWSDDVTLSRPIAS